VQGKQIELSASEYPDLSGLKEGATIKKMTIMDSKVISSDMTADTVTIEFGPTEIEMEGAADKALNEMKGPAADAGYGASDDEDEE
jgi:hypothetical protein